MRKKEVRRVVDREGPKSAVGGGDKVENVTVAAGQELAAGVFGRREIHGLLDAGKDRAWIWRRNSELGKCTLREYETDFGRPGRKAGQLGPRNRELLLER